MKKTILLFLLIGFLTVANGQKLELSTGISISHLDWRVFPYGVTNSFSTHEYPLIGFSFFGGINYFEKGHVFISSRIGYIRKGGKMLNGRSIITGENFATNLDYISGITTLNYQLNIIESVKFYCGIGPRIGYLFNYHERFEGAENFDQFKRLMYGMNIEPGFKISFNKFNLGIRYSRLINFKKILSWEADIDRVAGEIKDRTHIINLTFELNK